MFNLREGFSYGRDGNEVVIAFERPAKHSPQMGRIEIRVPVSEWASVVASTSYEGETTGKYAAALEFLGTVVDEPADGANVKQPADGADVREHEAFCATHTGSVSCSCGIALEGRTGNAEGHGDEFVLMLCWTCEACAWSVTMDAPGFAGDGTWHYPDGRTPCGPLVARRTHTKRTTGTAISPNESCSYCSQPEETT